ncbi:unnamed protein product [Lepeophtheirus salmonis]|uniref:(salmon louse) hypothetical protein n=1 Tax=Lepeophtheirus salmonis TaxID=72036 RepID=A0A7R8D218_LEPSM|nr:unnamed protein product [Lepeophtheirus salmonis]CAF3001385.1 unnamed protein product [Lepeophtheirus salmonis]
MGNNPMKSFSPSSSIRNRGIVMEELREEDEDEIKSDKNQDQSITGNIFLKYNNGHGSSLNYGNNSSELFPIEEENNYIKSSLTSKDPPISVRSTGVQSESGLDSTSTISVSPSSTFAFRDAIKHPSSTTSQSDGALWQNQTSDDDVNLAKVNLSGLRAATDTSRKKGRRYLWIFLLSVCFAVMIIQITDRLRHFISEPVSVSVTLARNKSLVFSGHYREMTSDTSVLISLDLFFGSSSGFSNILFVFFLDEVLFIQLPKLPSDNLFA